MENSTSRQKQSVETKNKIYYCAIDLFTQMSYEKVKISDICKAAKVSIGAFYHHFESKESIINEAYHALDEKLQEEWDSYIQKSTFETIRFLISLQLQMLKSDRSIFATQFFKNQLSNEDKYILNKDRFFYKTLLGVVQAAVDNKKFRGSVEEITDTLLRISRGTIYDWCLHEGSYELLKQGLKDIEMVVFYYSYNGESHVIGDKLKIKNRC